MDRSTVVTTEKIRIVEDRDELNPIWLWQLKTAFTTITYEQRNNEDGSRTYWLMSVETEEAHRRRGHAKNALNWFFKGLANQTKSTVNPGHVVDFLETALLAAHKGCENVRLAAYTVVSFN